MNRYRVAGNIITNLRLEPLPTDIVTEGEEVKP